MRLRLASALLLVLLAGGCVMRGMDEGEQASIGDDVWVTAQPAFAQINLGSGRYWTQNGTGLDELHFYTGIKNGQPLFSTLVSRKKETLVFDTHMTPNDIEDLTVASLQKAGQQHVRASDLRPCPFGAAQGFCFDLALTNEEGLEMRGRAIAALRGAGLDLLLFTAPAEYYFGAVSPAVDKVFGSIQAK